MGKVLELLDAMNKGEITNHDVIDILTKSDEKFVNHINNILTEKDHRLAELEEENESYQKLINDICNKHKIGGLKELDEKLGNLEELNVKFIEIGNEYAEKNKRLEEQLKNAIVPKFKIKQTVYSMLGFTEIFKGQIDVFDYYTQRYWVFFGDDIGCEWCCESELFKTKKETLAKLKELQGE